MEIDHYTLVAFAKTFGLFYLMVMAGLVTLYAVWPSNGKRFEEAAKSVLDDEEGPCRKRNVTR